MNMDPVHDMKEFYNNWRQNVQSWMNPGTLAAYRELQERKLYQQAHRLQKQQFGAYLFQLSRQLSDMMKDGICTFDDLFDWQRQLVEDFDKRM